MTSGDLFLTREESPHLSAVLDQAIDGLREGRNPNHRPKGSRRTSFVWSLIPTEAAPDG